MTTTELFSVQRLRFALLCSAGLTAAPALAGTFTVSTAADAGPGSLRWAIEEANGTSGADTIAFAIPGAGVQVIRLLTPLPAFIEAATIDGFTQAGGGNGILVQLDGAALDYGSGLELSAPSNTVWGLSVTRFPEFGMVLNGSGNKVEGNRIGADPLNMPAGNGYAGLLIRSSGNRIGNSTFGAGNVISANKGPGIGLVNPSASNNIISGNFIGTDSSGSNALANAEDGILLYDAPNNLIGGTAPGAGNVIAGNLGNGIQLQNPSCSGNRIEGNTIGTDRNLTAQIGNRQDGVRFTDGAHDNTVGGATAEAGNWIANSPFHGVNVASGSGNGVLGNNFANNALKPLAVASGANGNVQPPKLESAFRLPGQSGFTTEGRVTGMPNTTYHVRLYHVLRDRPDPQHPAGLSYQRYVGTSTVTTDEFGNGSFAHHTDWVGPSFERVSATITGTNNTSELSDSIYIKREGTVDLVMVPDPVPTLQQGGTANLSATVLNRGPEDAQNVRTEIILPPGSTFRSATSSAGTASESNGVVSVGLGPMAKGQQATIGAAVWLGRPGLNRVTFQGMALGQTEGLFFDNQADKSFLVQSSNSTADVAVSVATDSQVEDGVLRAVLVTVTNRSSSVSATGVEVVVLRPLHDKVELVTPSQGTRKPSAFPHEYAWSVGTLPPRASARLNFTVRSLWDWTNPWGGYWLLYSARVSSTTPDANPDNNVATAGSYLLPAEIESHWEAARKQLAISYPTSSLARLEFTTSLTPPIEWHPVTEPPVLSNGQYVVGINTADPLRSSAFFALNPTSPPPPLPSLQLGQQALALDGWMDPFSDWGRARLTFLGQPGLHYFNLVISNKTVISNLPIASVMGTGVVQSVETSFRWGDYGLMVTESPCAWSLTPAPRSSPPTDMVLLPVGPDPRNLYRGFDQQFLYYFPAKNLIVGPVVTSVQGRPVFPNREQGRNECAPAAAANSLEYLNQGFGLGIPPGDLTIHNMKEAVGWTSLIELPPVGPLLTEPLFVDLKNRFMQTHGWPITTETTTDINLAIAALRNNYNLEIWCWGHLAAVRSIADVGGGQYVLHVVHDVRQGNDREGAIVEVVLYDANTGEIRGSSSSRQFLRWIIERPGP